MATSSTSPPPTDSDSHKKRKREFAPTEEIEVDVDLPEPPSKKAARRAKKGKTSTAPKASLNDVSDLIDDNEQGSKTTEAGAATEPAAAAVDASAAPVRSPHGIWIGNLSFLTTPASLRHFLCTTASLKPSQITRVHLPLSSRPLLPHQARQILTNAQTRQAAGTDGPAEPAADPPKFQSKGFAYVDFDSADALFQALQATEHALEGRNVLIKDATSFAGRPDPSVVAATAAAAAAGSTAVAADGKEGSAKPKSKRVFVGNLAFDTTREDLERHFGQAGEVDDAFVATFEDTGKCKGFGWVRFKTEDDAERAVKGWVWKTEGGEDGDEGEEEREEEEAEDEEEEDDDDNDDEEAGEKKKIKKKNKTKKETKKLSAPKKRKWWINKMHGRLLRCEYAEDASTRYKKRFGKGRREGQSEGPVEAFAGAEGGDDSGTHEKRRRHRVRGVEEKAHRRDARTIAPGQALANAPRKSVAIVQSQGKKVTFD